MGFPNIPNITPIISLSRDDAISLVVTSIAMEELGLSHILNAEGEKLQAILAATPTANVSDLLAINSSVQSMIETIVGEEAMLSAKLSSALQATNLVGPTGAVGATGPAGGPTGATGATGVISQDFAQFSVGSGPWPIAPPFTPFFPVTLANNDIVVGTAISHVPGTAQVNLAPGTYQITWALACAYVVPDQTGPNPVVLPVLIDYAFTGQLTFNGVVYAPSVDSISGVKIPGQSISSTITGSSSTRISINLTASCLLTVPAAGVLQLELTPESNLGGFLEPQNQSFSDPTLTILKVN